MIQTYDFSKKKTWEVTQWTHDVYWELHQLHNLFLSELDVLHDSARPRVMHDILAHSPDGGKAGKGIYTAVSVLQTTKLWLSDNSMKITSSVDCVLFEIQDFATEKMCVCEASIQL